ncbi:MAG: alpha/beta hydrolase [Zunongwangia sp.]|uniref:alpha/beta fold hydrolase n=1 Tax=Zunongwangia sp. TaxID=1965325 RepID=UPI003242C674
MEKTKFKTEHVDGINIAYREAGDNKKPSLLLLHGYPSSSHQYRKVFNRLADKYHLIAPDYPGFGHSDFPAPDQYDYTFDNISKTINSFLEKLEIDNYSIVMQDYGAPVGFRIALAHPERVTAIITQNGNAYEEGIGEAWKPIKKLWANRIKENEEALLDAFSLEGLKWNYTHGTQDVESINPDCWHLDYLRMQRPYAKKVNIDLWYDYQNNLKQYPQWQAYLREHQPPVLVVWGKNDEYFPESGAAAFKKDSKNIEYHIYDTGHFAMEEYGDEIINEIEEFMTKIA